MAHNETIYHPETKELFGTITEITNDEWPEDKYETNVLGYQDWYADLDEARTMIKRELQDEYSGKAAKDQAADRAYARQEQLATGCC